MLEGTPIEPDELVDSIGATDASEKNHQFLRGRVVAEGPITMRAMAFTRQQRMEMHN